MSRARITENPFYVLGLRPDCSRAELEREGHKLLGLLELGVAMAKTYATPLGPMPRSADSVRLAMAELRDPRRRFMHEMWAQLPASPVAAPASAPAAGPAGASTVTAGPGAAPPGLAEESPAAANPDTFGAPPPWPAARAALGFGARR